jgi:peptidoglycan/xylan/chitin deacetylase (PgdA/CDA1 family)
LEWAAVTLTGPRGIMVAEAYLHMGQTIRTRQLQQRHLRRRASALGAIALVALIAGMSSGSGGSGPAHKQAASQAPSGFLAQVAALAGSGPGSLAAKQQAAQSAAIDRTLSYTPLVRVAGVQHREIALTFDDGPGPYTPQILSILEHQRVPATFFEVGVLERYFHASTQEQVDRGFPIGDHTQSHAPMSKLSAKAQRTQLLQQISSMGNYGAPFPRLFRPPYGLWNDATLKILRGYKMLMVLWTIDSGDYKRLGVERVVTTVLGKARPGAIVLMHDAGGQRIETVEALPRIISGLRAQGYRLVTVPQLLVDNPPPVDQSLPPGVLGSGS